MISRRNFVVMTIMMLALFVLFQFTHIGQEKKELYARNLFSEESEPQSQIPEAQLKSTWGKMDREKWVFVGNQDSKQAKTLQNWCDYEKKKYIGCKTMEDLNSIENVCFLVVDPTMIQTNDHVEQIKKFTKKGASVLFYEIPDLTTLRYNKGFRNLLGIEDIVEESCTLEGMKLFSGFFLGGEAVYQPQTPEEEALMDLERNVPWFSLSKGTKVHMVGLLPEDTVENEKLPPLIWRNQQGVGFVYSINGDYFTEIIGLGILSAVEADANPVSLYPVINAQNISVVDFPGCADENDELLNEYYSRGQNAITRDILMPSLISFLRRGDFKLTAFMTPQMNYYDEIEPEGNTAKFIQQQAYQNSIELGQSYALHFGIKLPAKMEQDKAFYEEYFDTYEFAALYYNKPMMMKNQIQKGNFENVDTLVGPMDLSGKIVYFLTNKVTKQTVLSDGANYTYKSDLEMRSIQTAMGYSNMLFDMGEVFWPKEEEDRWENLADTLFSNAQTYLAPFSAFQKTTVSESDRRVRDYLNITYAGEKTEDAVRFETMGNVEDVWFVLRVHNQEIAEITGGEYTLVEKGVYLLRVTDQRTSVKLRPCDENQKLTYK